METVDKSYINHQTIGTYMWFSTTWWYYNKFFKANKNSLNLAFFSVASFVGSFWVGSKLVSSAQTQAFIKMGKAAVAPEPEKTAE